MAKKLHIDTDECMFCGTCADLCPDVFRLDDDLGYAVVINPEGASEDEIQEAIDSCPAACIHWEEE